MLRLSAYPTRYRYICSAWIHWLQLLVILFFFSSRRRHTRWPRDWSSDVCSSDLITSQVRREGDTYYLTGRKHLITFGMRCDYWLVFARLEGTSKSEGTVALLVDRHSSGVEVQDTSHTMGVRGTDHATLTFTDTPVPVSHRLGDEGDGLTIALGGFLTPSRISVAMSCVGLAQRAQQLAVDYARHRITFGKPIAARQAVSFMIAENEADIEAARTLVLHAAGQWEDGADRAGALSSMAKMVAVDMLTRDRKSVV